MNIKRLGGVLYFLIAALLFIWQIAYLLLGGKFSVEYVYNQLFFIINIVIVLFLGLALWLIFSFSKKQIITGISIILLFVLLNMILLFYDSSKVNTIRSLSPDSKHILLLKENTQTDETHYYRIYYQLFARKMNALPYQTKGEFKVKWLADDVAAVTYKAKDDTIHQYIGTYGYREDPNYKHVGPTISGKWESDQGEILVDTKGIHVFMDGNSEHYDWKEVVQFGTLAVVLVKNNQAEWTISLDENFKDNLNNSLPPSGHITLYKADFSSNEPIQLHFAPE